ncbi:MAG: ABC transporter ATP-binding protein, partial [Endomicrobiales bacterium]
MITLQSITVGYTHKPVLTDISFSVPAGDSLGIIGPNGSGKTTLFRTMTRTLKPWAGTVLFNNADLYTIARNTIATTMAAMPQFIEYPFGITVYDFVALGRYPHLKRFSPLDSHDRSVIDHCLKAADITALHSRNLQELSG